MILRSAFSINLRRLTKIIIPILFASMIAFILGLILAFTIQQGNSENFAGFKIALYNQDELSSSAIDYIKNTEEIAEVCTFIEVDSRNEIKKLVENNQVHLGVFIPENFSYQIMNGQNIAPELFLSDSSPFETALLIEYIGAFTTFLQATQGNIYTTIDYFYQLDPEANMNKVVLGINLKYITALLERGDIFQMDSNSLHIIVKYGSVFVLYFALLTTILLSSILSSEADINVFLRMKSIGEKPHLFIVSKFLVAMLFYLILLFPALFISFEMQTFFIILLLASLISSFGLFAFSIFKTHISSVIFIFTIVNLSVLLTSGVVSPSILPTIFSLVTNISPIYHIMQLLYAIFGSGVSGIHFIVIILSVCLFIIISISTINRRVNKGGRSYE